MSRILLIENFDDGPEPDRVRLFLDRAGRDYTVIRPHAGDSVPRSAEGLAAAVIYGGAQEIYQTDRFPYLADEHALAADAVRRDVPLLGLCLGAQCIAWAHGADVRPHPDGAVEFGYYDLTPAPEGQALFGGPVVMPQWHGHGFDLPDGATRLASSALYPNQAFRLGSAWAFQFHPEVTPQRMRRWQAHDAAPWSAPGAQDRDEQDRRLNAHDAAIDAWFMAFLARFFA